MKKCCYPNCKEDATSTWALVPLCIHHHKSIEDETNRYYTEDKAQRIPYKARENYMASAKQTPFKTKGVQL